MQRWLEGAKQTHNWVMCHYIMRVPYKQPKKKDEASIILICSLALVAATQMKAKQFTAVIMRQNL